MPVFDDIQEPMELLKLHLLALGLTMPRFLGMVLILPVFARLGLSGLLRSAVVVVLCFPVVPLVAAQLEVGGTPGLGEIAAVVIKELLIGLILGVLFGLPFWGIEAAGDVLDFYRGSSAAYLIDPTAASEASILGTVFVLVMMTLFFLAGGFLLILQGVYQSYGIWPTLDFTPRLTDASRGYFLGMLDKVMTLAMLFAAPLLIAMFMGEFAIAMVSRFAPQINVLELSLSVKNLILVLILPVYGAFALDQFREVIAPYRNALDGLRVFLE